MVRIRTRWSGHPTGRLDPVEAGHAYVHQDDVGTLLGGEADRLLAVLGLADHVDPRRRTEQGSKAGAGQRLIVDDEHGDT